MRILLSAAIAALLPVAPILAATDPVRISEIQIAGSKADDEFVRLANDGAADVDLAGWKLTKKSLSKEECKESVLVSTDHFAGTIPAGGTFLIAHQSYRDFYSADLDYSGKSYYLADDVSVLLYDKSGSLVDRKSVGTACDEAAPDPPDDPGPDSEATPPSDPVAVRINELFPNPKEKGEANEWVELANESGSDATIGAYVLRDASASGKYVFPDDAVVPAGGFLVVPRSSSKLSLNNSDETVSLLAPNGSIVDTVSYGSTKEDLSLNWDGKGYRWSKYLTPGAKNRLNNVPEKEDDDIPDEAYKNVPASFSAKGSDRDKEKLSYRWDFGDNHKSYKRETTHTYEKTGKYRGTLTISDGAEETVRKFTVEVDEYPKRKIRIIALSPNPEGRDSENEWILVRNEEKKKTVDLSGWIVATGSKKGKLSNHAVGTDIRLSPGEERALTSLDAKFSLPNKGGYVELRLPDKRTVQKLDYRDADGVPDDAVYRKTDGGPWNWETPAVAEAVLVADVAPIADLPEPKPSIPPIDPALLGGMSRVDGREKSESLPRLVASGTDIRAPYFPAAGSPRVMGDTTERTSDDTRSIFDTVNETVNRIISDYLVSENG